MKKLKYTIPKLKLLSIPNPGLDCSDGTFASEALKGQCESGYDPDGGCNLGSELDGDSCPNGPSPAVDCIAGTTANGGFLRKCLNGYTANGSQGVCGAGNTATTPEPGCGSGYEALPTCVAGTKPNYEW